MEGKIATLFSPDLMDRHPGLNEPEIECRSSTCRLTITYTEALKNQVLGGQRPDATVLGNLYREIGPYASRFAPVPSTAPLSDTFVLLFGEKEIDPNGYLQWADEMRSAMRAARQKKELEGKGPPLPAGSGG